ncbi:unnamed protein product [Linum tenue]|nr:unnamed protein product [Linum tenue]
MGKEYVVLTASVIVAYLLRRYDSMAGDGSTITALEKVK